MRHGKRQEEGVCGRKPSSTRRHVRARGSTRGGQEDIRGVLVIFVGVCFSRCAFLGFGSQLLRHALRSFGTEFYAAFLCALLPPNRFTSRHLYQFQERSCCPPIPRRTLKLLGIGGLLVRAHWQSEVRAARVPPLVKLTKLSEGEVEVALREIDGLATATDYVLP